MNKLFSASLLALGAMCATSAAAATNYSSWGIDLYIQDTSQPVIFTYGDMRHQSYAYDTIVVWVAAIDANGIIVNDWKQLFQSGGTQPDDIAYLVPGTSDLNPVPGDRYSFVYDNINSSAVELIFKWQDLSHYPQRWYHSGSGSDQVTYNYNQTPLGPQTLLGLEDNYGNTVPPGYDNDKNDVLIRMTNIGRNIPPPPVIPPPPPTIPEPETYAMMLAGLGLIGAVARRRRKSL